MICATGDRSSQDILLTFSVIIPTHNPAPGRIARVLNGLAEQTLPSSEWETVVVDNGSAPELKLHALKPPRLNNLRLIREPRPGLTAARLCGLNMARGEFCVFVDDDNVLCPEYLEAARDLFTSHPSLGAAGGPSRPEFESSPPSWSEEFLPLLALRDYGRTAIFTQLEHSAAGKPIYPKFAPIGAGMVLRRAAAQAWITSAHNNPLHDRRGAELTSGGDNDIVFSVLVGGWEVGYDPRLALTHLIPTSRVELPYLCQLNWSIQKSWMEVLTRHDGNPWPPIPRWSLRLRCVKAWFAHRAWAGPAERVRWRGACGHFEGRASVRARSGARS